MARSEDRRSTRLGRVKAMGKEWVQAECGDGAPPCWRVGGSAKEACVRVVRQASVRQRMGHLFQPVLCWQITSSAGLGRERVRGLAWDRCVAPHNSRAAHASVGPTILKMDHQELRRGTLTHEEDPTLYSLIQHSTGHARLGLSSAARHPAPCRCNCRLHVTPGSPAHCSSSPA